MAVWTEGNRIAVSGEITLDDSYRIVGAMHAITHNRGYRDVEIDFSSCRRAFSPQMMIVCSKSLYYNESGIDIEITLPLEDNIKRLFINTNWAHLMSPKQYEMSRYRGFTHAPVIRFTDGQEQTRAVDRILDILLAAISHFRRDEVRYIEWAINEITDNVMNHSQSAIGGLIQITNMRQRERIEVVVADAGIGIPNSLRQGHPEIHSDSEALHEAIREGVTRDKNFGQGNGLYGTWRICQMTEGEFFIHSGRATLSSPRQGEVTSLQKVTPINGTIVVGKIGYSDRFDLSDALVFSGKRHVPIDYIETHFQPDEQGNAVFYLKTESEGFGSRPAGNPVRRKIINILNCLEGGKLIIDMSDVVLVSSSYADEVFGKLFVELGPLQFMRIIEFKNVDNLVMKLIDRAIMQRSGV